MKIRMFGVALIGAALCSCATNPFLSPRLSEGEPYKRSELRSLGTIIKESGQDGLHIVYVHGMRADQLGASAPMISAIANHLGPGSKIVPEPLRVLRLSERPAKANIAGKCIWGKSDSKGGCNADPDWGAAGWTKSQPFLFRTTILGEGKRVVVDELNWWPLLLPLRCQFLVAPEHDLSGNDEHAIDVCSRDDERYHPWISKAEAQDMLDSEPMSGGGAVVNGGIKRSIMNWGLADAVIAIGPMRSYLNATVERAIKQIEGTNAREVAIITESLGSFVVLDALRDPNTSLFVSKASNLTFFANQFALLELARIADLPGLKSSKPTSEPTDQQSPLDALGSLPPPPSRSVDKLLAPLPRQILAISDPSDALTFRVPPIKGVNVSNVYVWMSGGPLGIVADPKKAHTAAIIDRAVWKELLEYHPSASGRRPRRGATTNSTVKPR